MAWALLPAARYASARLSYTFSQGAVLRHGRVDAPRLDRLRQDVRKSVRGLRGSRSEAPCGGEDSNAHRDHQHHEAACHRVIHAPSFLHRRQIGSRERRKRAAAASSAAAATRPIQRPGVLRNRAGVSWVSRSISPSLWPSQANATFMVPIKRYFTQEAKCEVWNTRLSRTAIASGGNTAHRSVARRAQPETSSTHP